MQGIGNLGHMHNLHPKSGTVCSNPNALLWLHACGWPSECMFWPGMIMQNLLLHIMVLGINCAEPTFLTDAFVGGVQDTPDWQEILTYFRGSELQNYFTRILEDDLHAIIKPQYVDHIPRAVKGNVEDVLIQKDGRGQREHLQKVLELEQVLDRDVEHLSGWSCCIAAWDGLLQHACFACALCMRTQSTSTVVA